MGLGIDTLDIMMNPDLDRAAKKQEILKLNRFYERVEKYEKADSIDKKFALLEESFEKRIAAETAILTKRFQEETNRLLDAVIKALGEVKDVVMAQGKELLASIDDSDKKTKSQINKKEQELHNLNNGDFKNGILDGIKIAKEIINSLL